MRRARLKNTPFCGLLFLVCMVWFSVMANAGPAQRIEAARQAIESKLEKLARGFRCEAVCVVSTGYSAEPKKIFTDGLDVRLAYELLHTRCVLYNTFARTNLPPNSGVTVSDSYIPNHGWLYVVDTQKKHHLAVDKAGKPVPATAQTACKAIGPASTSEISSSTR